MIPIVVEEKIVFEDVRYIVSSYALKKGWRGVCGGCEWKSRGWVEVWGGEWFRIWAFEGRRRREVRVEGMRE